MSLIFRIAVICFFGVPIFHNCRADDRIPDNRVPLSVAENYTVVSFEMLKNDPKKYSGALVAIDVYLARDSEVLDSDKIPALFDKESEVRHEPALDSSKVQVNIVYADMLHKFGFNQWCRVYGVYYVPCSGIDVKELYSFIRIDRVEGSRSVLNFYFQIEPKK